MLVASLCLLGLFLLFNLLAYRHARAMTRFSPGGNRTRRPENLSRWEKVRVLLSGIELNRPLPDATPADVGLPFEVHTVQGAVGKLEAWFVPHPQPLATVPMFHGYANCKSTLLAEARILHELGYACFLVDFPGSGGTEGNDTTIGYREAIDVVRVAAYVRQRWPGPSILFGQSMGGAAVLRAVAREGLRADALILESPFNRLLSTVAARFEVMGLPPFPGAIFLVFWGGLRFGFNGFAHNPVEYARKVIEPVLLMHSSEDRRVKSHQIRAVFENLAGSKHLHTFVGLGHQSFAAARPEEWRACVLAFLQGLASRVAQGGVGVCS